MENKKVQVNSGSFGLGTILFIVFLILKLTGVISWAWIWVFMPLIVPVALFLLLLLIAGIIAIAAVAADK